MKIAKNRKTATAIALILMFAMAAFMIVMPAVHAVTFTEQLLISIAPDPVGVGQTMYVNVFFTHPTITSAGHWGDRYQNIKVEITHPDGTKETFGPYTADSTGGTWFSYVPATTGNYTFQATYPGQTLTGTNPAAPTTSGASNLQFIGSYVNPVNSEKLTLVVQEAPVKPAYQTPPLPTEYWSRPIYATNWDWAKLGGNWYGTDDFARANVNLYTTAPNTGHILWVKPTHFGGQVGAPIPSDQESQYMSTSLLVSYFPDARILNGILYYNQYISSTSKIGNWVAVDLRTGQTLWTRTAGETGSETIARVQALKWHTIQEYGSIPYIWTFSGGTFRLYDAMTGVYLCNITGAQNVLNVIDWNEDTNEKGTFLGWYTTTNSTGNYLTLWNSTQCIAYSLGRGPYYMPSNVAFMSTFRAQGSINFSMGNMWTVKLATNVPTSISARTPKYLLFRSAPTIGTGMFGLMSAGYQVTAGYDARTGALLWGPLNQTLPYSEDLSVTCYGDDVYVLTSKTSHQAWGYSLSNGQKLWGPVALPGNAWSHLSITGQSAYGMAYIIDFGGYVNALDLKTGEIKWTFTRGSSNYDTPFGVYPIWYFSTASICDGKIFLSEGHVYDPPMFPNAHKLAINATTGKLVWSTLGFDIKSVSAHADGMMVAWNCYDMQIYTYGKGPSATTVSAPLTAVTIGQSAMITGTVIDESPGTKDSDRTARFPHGVAAVNDASQSTWMEYVYMQQPYPTNCTGVEVTLDAYDPNGNFVHLGTATSDTTGFYSYMWQTPPVPGEYRIIARFAGSESYYGSYAEAALGVVEAAPATTAPQYPVPADYTLPIVGTGIVLLIAIAIVGLILFRKKP
jgi:hypothetical protein